MALPPLTPEQRAEALQKAAIARKERADVKNRLKRGAVTLSEVIKDGSTDDIIGKMKVSALLESLPGVGKVRAPSGERLTQVARQRHRRRAHVHHRVPRAHATDEAVGSQTDRAHLRLARQAHEDDLRARRHVGSGARALDAVARVAPSDSPVLITRTWIPAKSP